MTKQQKLIEQKRKLDKVIQEATAKRSDIIALLAKPILCDYEKNCFLRRFPKCSSLFKINSIENGMVEAEEITMLPNSVEIRNFSTNIGFLDNNYIQLPIAEYEKFKDRISMNILVIQENLDIIRKDFNKL